MDLRQLNALVAIADHGSFSAAARALHTVQSNVSTHVARLERELDAQLVDRGTGTLTEEGVTVVERARRIGYELDALAADVASLHDEVTGDARMGVIGTTARWLVPVLLNAMRRTHPGVHLIMVDATTTSLLPQLSSGALDLAVINLPCDADGIAADPLFDEDTVVVAPIGHPLYDLPGPVSLTELAEEPLLLAAPGTVFRARLDAAAAGVGVEMQSLADIDGMRLLASLAFSGFGAAILPATAAPGWIDGDWKRVAVTNAPGRAVGVARRSKGLLSAPARVTLETLQTVIAAEVDTQPYLHSPA